MHRSTRRLVAPLLLSLLVTLGAPGHGSDEARTTGENGFSGTWALAAARDDVVVKLKKEGWDVLGGGGPGSAGGLGSGGGFDLPLEVMTDARRLVVTDDGTTLRVTYPSGRKRAFVTDGKKRYLDDGDGPADVTARRKGTTVTVTSEWFRGYRLRETWELRAAPRRLVVTGKVRGRESQEYVRTYEPGPPAEAVPAPVPAGAIATPPATPAPDGTPPAPAAVGSSIEPAPPAVNRLSECSIRPPKNSGPEELGRLVRVSQEEAGKAAVASLAPLKPSSVISSDVEVYEGCLVWPFTLRLPGKGGVQEVFVDAGDGKVVASSFERTGPSAGEPPAP